MQKYKNGVVRYERKKLLFFCTKLQIFLAKVYFKVIPTINEPWAIFFAF